MLRPTSGGAFIWEFMEISVSIKLCLGGKKCIVSLCFRGILSLRSCGGLVSLLDIRQRGGHWGTTTAIRDDTRGMKRAKNSKTELETTKIPEAGARSSETLVSSPMLRRQTTHMERRII